MQGIIFLLFGFFKAFKPSEPFLTPYLVQDKHFTAELVKREIYPIWTYSYFLLILPVALLAEKFGYRKVIFLEVIGHLSTRAILIFCFGLGWMQVCEFFIPSFTFKVMQVTFGLACAGELVYYSFVFKVFPTLKQQKITTSLSRAAVLAGHCFGSLLEQLLLLNHSIQLEHLFWISGVAVLISSIISLGFVSDAQLGSVGSEIICDSEEIIFENGEGETVPLVSPYPEFFQWNSKHTLINAGVPFLLYALHMTHLYNIEGYSSVLWYKILENQGVSGDRAKLWNGFWTILQ